MFVISKRGGLGAPLDPTQACIIMMYHSKTSQWRTLLQSPAQSDPGLDPGGGGDTHI
jgi:hypothetical protein